MAEPALMPFTADWPQSCSNLVEVVRTRASMSPRSVVSTFLDYSSDKAQAQTLDCESLDKRARQIAAMLQARARAGSRILLLYPAGLDYLCAFFGCLYAGMIAVPAYPPLNPRLRERLAAVAQDCDAAVALTTRATLEDLGDRSAMLAPLARIHWFTTDTHLDGLEHAWRQGPMGREHVAFLQYTSGSTGTPKGVIVRHGNVLHNVRAIALQMQLGPHDHGFSWLPPYHDMGLVGSILTPLCTGVPFTFMTPHAFLRRPARWLREIAVRKCTISGAPNFAYDLCVSKVTDEDIGSLDLSSWTLAFTGAEPVKRRSIERFAQRFAPSGFDAKAFYPCYGMAETTLIITGKRRDEAFKVCTIDKGAYASDRLAVIAQNSEEQSSDVQSIVSCGTVAPGLCVEVVDPVSLIPIGPGKVGEIVVAGDSVAAGYWNRELETLATFGVCLPGRQGRYLRTGDLGFFHDDELHVSGRVKDLIIIRGVNHYPQDIEGTVDQCHEAIRPGCGICFSIERGDEEHLVVVQEIARRDESRSHEILQAIRMAIVDRHEIHPHAVVLIDSGSIHKTTSGKLSRRPCRDAFLNGELQVLSRWDGHSLAPSAPLGATADA